MYRYHQQFCPIARASEIFAERWTPIIVRNLLLGCKTFNALAAGAPGISRSVLAQRLRLLEDHGIIEHQAQPRGQRGVYALTASGAELQQVCDALGNWGARWIEAAPEGLDPLIVLWATCRFIDASVFPQARVVVRVNVPDMPRLKNLFWLVIQHPEAEVCRKYCGFPDDLVMTTESKWLAQWHMGRISLQAAIRQNVIDIQGAPALINAFTRCGGVTPFASIEPANSARQSTKIGK
jgi:DNA-binding HxlR family transcriptional regulator